MLAVRQLRPLIDAIYEMNIAGTHSDFATAVTSGLGRLIPADVCHLHVVDRATGRILHQAYPANPYTPEEIAYYISHPGDNAFVTYFERTGDTRARRLSDVTDPAAYRRTEFFRRCLARLDFHHSLVLTVGIDAHTIAALAFDRRRRDFSPRHCALLDAFAPHFRLAWSRHRDPWERADKPGLDARERLLRLGLTLREADVLHWVTEGKQNREIATILSLSLGTVQEYVGNILRKLGIENRHQLTVYVLRTTLGR